MDDSYTKGKKRGQQTIGATINGVMDDIKTSDDMTAFLSYLWGIRDAYSDTLTEYMPRMIPIKLPEDINDTERTMYWELASHITTYYNTITDQAEHVQSLVNDSTTRALDVILSVAKSKLDHDVYVGMLDTLRDAIDERLAAASREGKTPHPAMEQKSEPVYSSNHVVDDTIADDRNLSMDKSLDKSIRKKPDGERN